MYMLSLATRPNSPSWLDWSFFAHRVRKLLCSEAEFSKPPPVTTRQHSQLYDFRCKKFPEKSLLCRFLWEFLLFIILSATNLLQYVPVPVRLCFLHDRLPVNRILIYLLFCSLLTYSALIFLADEILPTVSY